MKKWIIRNFPFIKWLKSNKLKNQLYHNFSINDFDKSINYSISEIKNFKKVIPSIFTRSSQWNFFFYAMDIKEISVGYSLFVDTKQSNIVEDIHNSNCVVLKEFLAPDLILIHQKTKIRNFIILDNHDEGIDTIYLNHETNKYIAVNKLKVIYIKLQIYDRNFYSWWNKKHTNNILFLSMPLLLGGSKYHISTGRDHSGESLFIKTMNGLRDFKDSKKIYDWSFIGSISSDDRKRAVHILENINKNKMFKSILSISTPGFSTANLAKIPFEQYQEIIKTTKINISLNGNGIWTLKDGECFSLNTFILRQYHPNISINPLTPRHQDHWIIFKNSELEDLISYYLTNTTERERIERAGSQYFETLLTGFCASRYLPGIDSFFKDNEIYKNQLYGIIL